MAKHRDEARNNLLESQQAAKAHYDSRKKRPSFRVRDFVYCTVGARSSSLDPYFEGPFEIVNFESENTVTVKRAMPCPGRSDTRLVNLEQIKHCFDRNSNAIELSDTAVGEAL